MAYGAVYVTIIRASLNGEVEHDGAYCRFSVIDSRGKGKADPQETKRIQDNQKPEWNSPEHRFDLLEPLGAATKLSIDVRDKRSVFPDTKFGTAEISLFPVNDEERVVPLKDGEGGEVTIKARYDGPPPAGGGGAAAAVSEETIAAAASGDPVAQAAVAAASSGSSSGMRTPDPSKLPQTAQGERVTLRIMPLAARSLVPPEVDAASGEIVGKFRMVRVVVRQGTTVHMKSSRPVPAAVDGNDIEWSDALLVSMDSPGGAALWTLSAEIIVLACGPGGGDDGIPVGAFTVYLSQIWAHKQHCFASQWLGIAIEGNGCTGFLKVDAALALGGSTPPDPDALGSELDQERKCIFSPFATRETVLLHVDLYRAEDIPEMDSDSLGGKLSKLFDKATDDSPTMYKKRERGGNGPCDPFAVLSVGGQEVESRKIDNSLCPVWNQKLVVPMSVPTLSRYIRIDLWDHDDLGPNDPCSIALIPIRTLTKTVKEKREEFENLETGMEVKLYDLAGLQGVPSALPKGKPFYWATVMPPKEVLEPGEEYKVYVKFDLPEGAAGQSPSPRAAVPGSPARLHVTAITKSWWEKGPGGTGWEADRAPRRRKIKRHLPRMAPQWINMYGRAPGHETSDSTATLLLRDEQQCNAEVAELRRQLRVKSAELRTAREQLQTARADADARRDELSEYKQYVRCKFEAIREAFHRDEELFRILQLFEDSTGAVPGVSGGGVLHKVREVAANIVGLLGMGGGDSAVVPGQGGAEAQGVPGSGAAAGSQVTLSGSADA
eukprot:TRINITY_DN1601_c1_g2_i2.p1 TRINITY_DN1601_c1_g2~~TRINITY_DN1601_c1_g2_i2.p1  ORF type:complete len:777 (+),score=288.22 TRINITY_DN1601_c1_g2_i2:134-2464(+)